MHPRAQASPPIAVVSKIRDFGAVRACDVSGVFINLWVAPPTATSLEQLGASQREWVKTRGEFLAMTVIEAGVGFQFDDETRKTGSELEKEFEHQIRANATVVEAAGFQGSIVRSVLSGYDFVTRRRNHRRVFDDVESAAAWLAARQPGDAGLLTAAIVAATQRLRDSSSA